MSSSLPPTPAAAPHGTSPPPFRCPPLPVPDPSGGIGGGGRGGGGRGRAFGSDSIIRRAAHSFGSPARLKQRNQQPQLRRVPSAGRGLAARRGAPCRPAGYAAAPPHINTPRGCEPPPHGQGAALAMAALGSRAVDGRRQRG